MAKRTISGGVTTRRHEPSTRTVLDEQALALGTRIRERRRAKGLSLVRLAEIADLSHPFLSQVERGHARPSISVAAADRGRRSRSTTGWLLDGGVDGPRSLCRWRKVVAVTATATAANGEPEAEARPSPAAGSRRPVAGHRGGAERGEAVIIERRGCSAYGLEGPPMWTLDGEVHSWRPSDAIFVAGHRPRRLRSTSGDRAHVLVFVVDRPDRATYAAAQQATAASRRCHGRSQAQHDAQRP